jgi:catechol 2,3-dioxygenase-like lactoylglutathione lyase family enzyme
MRSPARRRSACRVKPGHSLRGVYERVTLRASELEASRRFYDTVLATLGVAERGDFTLVQADEARPVTRRLHLGFVARSHAEVDEFWRVGTAAGYRDDGAPGPRPQYRDDYYGSFLLDPDGNSAEAVHHGALRRGGIVDHLWIRVADVPTSKRFYEGVAPGAGFRLVNDRPGHAHFAAESGSFSLVSGTPTEHLQMAFPAREDAAVVDPDGNTVELVQPPG